MSDANRREMQSQIRLQGSARKKIQAECIYSSRHCWRDLPWRRSGIRIHPEKQNSQPPHTASPQLDLSIAIPAMTEKEKSSAPNASIVLQDAPLEPLSDAATPHQEQVMDTSASSINAAHESDSAPNPAPKPMEMQIFGSEGTLRPDIADTPSQIPTGQASIETIPQQTPPVMAKQLDPEQLARCALAFRISGEATRLASLSGDDNQDTRARAFQVKFLSACSGLSISINDLQDAAAKIPDEDVNKLAESILAGS